MQQNSKDDPFYERFHQQLLENEKFINGDFTTKFMDDFEIKS